MSMPVKTMMVWVMTLCAVCSLIGCKTIDIYSEEYQQTAPLADCTQTFANTHTAQQAFSGALSAANAYADFVSKSTIEQNHIHLDCLQDYGSTHSVLGTPMWYYTHLTFSVDIAITEDTVTLAVTDARLTPYNGTGRAIDWGYIGHTGGEGSRYTGGKAPNDTNNNGLRNVRTDGSKLYQVHVQNFQQICEIISGSSASVSDATETSTDTVSTTVETSSETAKQTVTTSHVTQNDAKTSEFTSRSFKELVERAKANAKN